jgi:hypothetical protein
VLVTGAFDAVWVAAARINDMPWSEEHLLRHEADLQRHLRSGFSTADWFVGSSQSEAAAAAHGPAWPAEEAAGPAATGTAPATQSAAGASLSSALDEELLARRHRRRRAHYADST